MRGLVVAVALGTAVLVSARPASGRAAEQPATNGGVVLRAMSLRAEGKAQDALALLEPFVASHPGDPVAHLELASTYADLAKTTTGADSSATAARQKRLQQAAAEFERAIAADNGEIRYMALGYLARLQETDGLNRPADAERYARRMVEADPARIEGYALLSQYLEGQARYDAAADTLRAARRSVPDMPALFQLRLAQFLVQQVTETTPALPAATAGPLLQEARTVLDEVIARKEAVRMALMAKSMVVKLQAERIETRADRRAALLAESDAIYEQSRRVSDDGSPVVLSVADEWFDARGKAAAGGVGAPEDGHVYEQFVAAHPDFVPARVALGHWNLSRAEAITDRDAKATAARTQLLETALTDLRRAADTATDDADRTAALADIIDALGPKGLNRTAEALSAARTGLAAHPDNTLLVMRMLELVLPSADAANDAAIREALAATPPNPTAQHMAGTYFWFMAVDKKTSVAPDVARRLLSGAISAFDAALKVDADYLDAVDSKGIVLRIQAKLEPDPARAKALVGESDQLLERAKQLRAARDKK